MSEQADRPTICPMCGSDGSPESPGCGHCRPELRSNVMIRSRRDPAPQESVAPVPTLARVGFILSVGAFVIVLPGTIMCLRVG